MTNTETACAWQCGDTETGHSHYAVLVHEDGKLLGRLCPDGTTTARKIYAAVLSKECATEIASEIDNSTTSLGTLLTAKAIKF